VDVQGGLVEWGAGEVPEDRSDLDPALRADDLRTTPDRFVAHSGYGSVTPRRVTSSSTTGTSARNTTNV
jgi:hypothetical protein